MKAGTVLKKYRTCSITSNKEHKAKSLKNKKGVFVRNGSIIAKSSIYDEAIFIKEATGLYSYGDITWHREDKIRFKSVSI